MSHYLVTGGAGFIGSHLVDALLAAGQQVRVVDDLSTGRRENVDPRAEFVAGDIADSAMMRALMQDMDGCFHLAAIASVQKCTESWVETHRTNMAGTVAVFDACRRAGNIPVVYASSAAVYGTQEVMPIAETASCAPRSAYGADKLGAELHASAAFATSGLPSAGLRFFNVYGPRQDPSSPYSGVISIFVSRIAAGRKLTIFGDGTQTRDFIYVADIVSMLRAAMARLHADPAAIVCNACTGTATSVRDLALLIGGLLRVRPVIEHQAARDGDIRNSLGDPARACTVLHRQSRVTLAEGLRHLIEMQPRAAA